MSLYNLKKIPARSVFFLLNLYQKTISPDHSWVRVYFPYGACRFYPTCSEYAKVVILKKSFILAIFLIIKRLISCHPWACSRHYNT